MDDGSRNVAESISLMTMQLDQGISTVIATPHFYANDEPVEVFLDRRKSALETLKEELPDGYPTIIPGAEVRYYQGISRMPGLKKLRIQGSKLLLLEMPMTRWTEYMIRELVELAGMSGIRLVLAHIERYLSLQKQDVWTRLYESGIIMQVNASFFLSFTSRRKALSLLQEGKIHLVGSDCHDLTSRPPQIGEALAYLQKKLGDEFVNQMNKYGYSILEITNNE
jgi:protein-tyrosine phosphatase